MTHIIIEIKTGVVSNVISNNDDIKITTIDRDVKEHFFGGANQIMTDEKMKKYVEESGTEISPITNYQGL